MIIIDIHDLKISPAEFLPDNLNSTSRYGSKDM